MTTNNLFYVAPRESMELILTNGILTPRQVRELIEAGKLPKEVLGVSFHPDETNHFPDHISLVTHVEAATGVAQAISHGKTGIYENPEFMAIGYEISEKIRSSPNFLDEDATKKLNSNCYEGEVLHQGPIPREFILIEFAVRPYTR